MKVTYTAQKVEQPCGHSTIYDYLRIRSGTLFVPDSASAFDIKAKIEGSHAGWYAATWKANRDLRGGVSPTEQGVVRTRVLARRKARATQDAERERRVGAMLK